MQLWIVLQPDSAILKNSVLSLEDFFGEGTEVLIQVPTTWLQPVAKRQGLSLCEGLQSFLPTKAPFDIRIRYIWDSFELYISNDHMPVYTTSCTVWSGIDRGVKCSVHAREDDRAALAKERAAHLSSLAVVTTTPKASYPRNFNSTKAAS